MTWRPELDRYLRYLRGKGTSANYRSNTRSALEHLGNRFDPDSYLDLRRDDFVTWFDELREGGITGERALSDATMYYTAAIAKACLRWLNDGETPASLRRLAIGRRRSRVEAKEDLLTGREFERLVRGMPLDKRVLFRLLRATGARPGEVLDLRRKDARLLDHQGKAYAEVTFRNTKTGTHRTVPIGYPAAIAELREYLEAVDPERETLLFPSPTVRDRPLQYGSIHTYLRKKARAVGISKRVYPYMFRHMRATELMDKNTPRPHANRLMGWKGGMWENYAHLGTDDVRDWVLEHEASGEGPEAVRETVQEELEYILGKLQDIEGLETVEVAFSWADGTDPTVARVSRQPRGS